MIILFVQRIKLMTKMLIKLITFLYVFVVYVNITNAEPITFRGVNMAMQHSEIVGLLKRKKFKCEVDIYYANCYVNESKKRPCYWFSFGN